MRTWKTKIKNPLPSPFPKRTTEAQSRREESFLKRAVVELNHFSPVKNQLLRLFPSVHRRLVTTGRGPHLTPQARAEAKSFKWTLASDEFW